MTIPFHSTEPFSRVDTKTTDKLFERIGALQARVDHVEKLYAVLLERFRKLESRHRHD